MNVIRSTMLITLLVTGCAEKPEEAFKEGREIVKSKLVDPESAQFKEETKGTLDGKPTYCGQVNSKNRMGGYNGFTNFIVVGNDVSFKTDEQIRALGFSGMQLYYERHAEACHGRGAAVTFKDGRRLIRSLIKDGEIVQFQHEKAQAVSGTKNYCGYVEVELTPPNYGKRYLWFIARGSQVEFTNAETLDTKNDSLSKYINLQREVCGEI